MSPSTDQNQRTNLCICCERIMADPLKVVIPSYNCSSVFTCAALYHLITDVHCLAFYGLLTAHYVTYGNMGSLPDRYLL